MTKKCENCKHCSCFAMVFNGLEITEDYKSRTCKLKDKKVDPEHKCWRFIKKNGVIHKLQKKLRLN